VKVARKLASRVRISTSGILGDRGALVGRLLAVLSVVAMSWWYFAAHRQPSVNRHHGLITTLGWTALALSVLAASMSIRKRMAYQGIGKLSAWLSVHSYVGIVAAFAVLYHSSFRAGSLLTACLLGSFWFVGVSGGLGLLITRKVPRLLTAIEENPAIVEELLVTREECLRGMLELARAGSPEFRLEVEKRLLKETASWTRIVRFYRNRSTLSHELPAFQKEHEAALRGVKPHEQRPFQRAAEYALRVNKMNAELFLQRVLRGWLTLHMTSTAAMFGLAAVHVFSVLYY
jgi:hypothetical protein